MTPSRHALVSVAQYHIIQDDALYVRVDCVMERLDEIRPKTLIPAQVLLAFFQNLKYKIQDIGTPSEIKTLEGAPDWSDITPCLNAFITVLSAPNKGKSNDVP